MNRNYGNKRERVGIRRLDGKEGDKLDLLIMVGEHGNNRNKRENVGAGGNALAYKEKKHGIYEKMLELIYCRYKGRCMVP